jgi:hypothetical protein
MKDAIKTTIYLAVAFLCACGGTDSDSPHFEEVPAAETHLQPVSLEFSATIVPAELAILDCDDVNSQSVDPDEIRRLRREALEAVARDAREQCGDSPMTVEPAVIHESSSYASRWVWCSSDGLAQQKLVSREEYWIDIEVIPFCGLDLSSEQVWPDIDWSDGDIGARADELLRDPDDQCDDMKCCLEQGNGAGLCRVKLWPSENLD